MDFSIALKGFSEAMKSMDPQVVIKSGQRAIRRAAASGKTIIASQVSGKFNILKRDVDRKINVKLNLQAVQATLTTSSSPISLMYFKPEEIKGGFVRTLSRSKKGIAVGYGKGPGGVRVKIIRKRPGILRHAFMAKGKGGTPLVFRRLPGTKSPVTGKEKLAKVAVVTYPSIMKQPENLSAIENKINTILFERFKHEINEGFKH